tara:strand:+ start:239 stop:490 length:252 start_codon:yes stop_codon:yes gene_type:complete
LILLYGAICQLREAGRGHWPNETFDRAFEREPEHRPNSAELKESGFEIGKWLGQSVERFSAKIRAKEPIIFPMRANATAISRR